MTESIVYCVDSSALIYLRIHYRRSTFPGVWQDLAQLVRAQRLIAPQQVWAEIKKDDVLPEWVREDHNRRMFVRLKTEGLRIAKEITNGFPGLVDPDRETPDADPFVIALAIEKSHEQQELFHSQKHVVITTERANPQGKPRIPDACQRLEVECMFTERALADLFEREGWHYKK